MGQQAQLTLSLDDALDINFADDLLSQFDMKRDLLHSNNNTINNGDHTSILADSLHSKNNNHKLDPLSHSILPPTSQYHQMANNERPEKVNQDPVITPSTTPDLHSLLPPELTDNVTLNTTLSLPLTNLGTSHGHPTDTHDLSLDGKFKPKSTTASLPGTITDRAHRRRQHNLLRRSSTYLRQKFFAGADAATESPPPLPTDPISTTHSDNVTDPLGTTVASNNMTHGQKIKTTFPLSLPPTPPSSSIPNIPSSPPPSNPDTNATTTTPTAAATTATPQLSPCQYPPKPLQYCPVDPPNDRHRASFPIFSWRKKYLKEPRRQSEPTITSGHIKTRKSFFFL